MVWRSELIEISLVDSTSMEPFGSTAATRAVRVVLKTRSRLVVPSPASCVLPEVPARLAHGPVARVNPARALTELAVLEAREVFVVPDATAEAFSTTRIVRMSSTWLARRSRVPSASREPGDQIDPGEAAGAAAERAVASVTYRSSEAPASGLSLDFAASASVAPIRIRT